MTDTIAVALSGGIDSLFAAWLLTRQGHRVVGLHFITGYEPAEAHEEPLVRGYRLADRLAEQLSIDMHIVDLRRAFQTEVVDGFIREYDAGRTPNPCMICNPAIKFGHLLRAAQKLGAHRLATGHYARVSVDPHTGRHVLHAGLDPRKDQSYFLARLSQDQLAMAVFPLGDQTKASVTAEAASRGLVPATRAESQDICFVPQGQYRKFLDRHRNAPAVPGPIDHTDGRRLGQHGGLYRYTIGQRRGITIPADRPYYVVGMDVDANRLIVGDRSALMARGCHVTSINWIAPPPPSPIAAQVRIRYRSPAASATVHPSADGNAIIRFDTPQSAITPGQGAVFYHGDRVLGGGWIHAAIADA